MSSSGDLQRTQPLSPLLGESSAATYTVQLLGFSTREQTLFASVFKLSIGRPMHYVQFDAVMHPHADFFIVDAQDPAAIEQFIVIDPESYGGALFIGAAPFNSDHPVISRPIRWAEVLLRLDELPRPAHPAQVAALVATGIVQPSQVSVGSTTPPAAETAAPGLAPDAENDLEISTIQDWYDRDNVVTFQTDPAVLVVDGDIAARRYMAAKFIDLKYRVDFAESGEQALEFARVNRYNAIFIETMLPGIDGYEVCKALKARADRRRVAIVFVTARVSTLDRVKGAMAGCDAYLTKPIDQEKLVAVLDKFLPNWRLQLPLV